MYSSKPNIVAIIPIKNEEKAIKKSYKRSATFCK